MACVLLATQLPFSGLDNCRMQPYIGLAIVAGVFFDFL
jgi:hypothetical protein